NPRMRIALLGFGLINGSLARALHARGIGDDVVAWSPTGRGPARAAADGVIVGAPALASLDLVAELASSRGEALPADATVTDVVSTKTMLLAAADAVGLPFVGGHPMAGRETAGYESATADLFEGRPWVIVPGAAARPADIERVDRLATSVGAV